MAHLDLQRGTFAAADTLLGTRAERRIGHNTRAYRDGPDRIAVRLYSTDVYTMTRDGWAIIRTRGWDTVTTWDRVNGLLPGPWHIASAGKRGRYLYSGGRPIVPFADGLAVNVETGAVGFAAERADVGVILTAEDVAAVIAAEDVKAAERAAKRAERIAREHAEGRERDTLAAKFAGREPIASDGERLRRLVAKLGEGGYHPRQYNGLHWDCPECAPIRAEREAARKAALQEAHDAGKHAPDPRGLAYGGGCPWECPARERRTCAVHGAIGNLTSCPRCGNAVNVS